ncbi:FKBP-type peptidyl-prolyl cis-trans isomerase [Mucilaginibacter sp. AW1-3]
MKKQLMILAVAAIGLAGCKGGFKQGDGGMLYNIADHKSSATIKEGDFVCLNGVIKTEGDSVLSSTYESGHPAFLLAKKPDFKGDLISALYLVGSGDSIVVKINADTVAKRTGQPKPPGFKGKYFIYSIRIEKVIAKEKGMADSTFQRVVSTYIKSIGDAAKAAEPGKIKKYIESNKLTATTTASGLNYVITTPGDNVKPAVGDTVVANYVGKFLNGKVFDTSLQDVASKNKMPPSHPYQPMRVAVGAHAIIPGLDEGMMLLSKGAKATFVIPSSLGYGEQGGGPIPPSSPLVFDIEVISIVHANPNAPKPAAPMMPGQPQAKK